MIAVVKETGVPVYCCGEPMQEVVPNTVDAAAEKHVPVYEVSGNTVHVKVGSVGVDAAGTLHWMDCAIDETGKSAQAAETRRCPEACFTIYDSDEVEAVYEYCNLHGLWKG